MIVTGRQAAAHDAKGHKVCYTNKRFCVPDGIPSCRKAVGNRHESNGESSRKHDRAQTSAHSARAQPTSATPQHSLNIGLERVGRELGAAAPPPVTSSSDPHRPNFLVRSRSSSGSCSAADNPGGGPAST